MDRTVLQRHLSEARTHAALGKEHIERQQQIIADLGRDGHDTARALALLRTFEETQNMHLADVARLEAELGRDDLS